ncbi:leucine-rich repeat-containing protein 15-like [Penaeus chinensis]|uniref:leucine-rich repeat-containing protein 15-like n=1 Tax=Penaeus chinensis TaxID=139456 RepID=UPI001FB5EE9C|nr:leucine-rich repeat-containing protein 15-like [Penaeus chinensis]
MQLEVIILALSFALCGTFPWHLPYTGQEANPRADPCPSADLILPCECFEEEENAGVPSMRCENVADAHVLDTVFLQDFPNPNLMSFTVSHSSLGYLHQDIFHGKTFQNIRLTGGGVSSLAPGVLDNSRETLTRFFVNDNHLTNFSLQDLHLFPHVDALYLSNNQLLSIDALVGMPEQSTLSAFYVSRNYITSLHPDVFKSVPGISSLRLDNNRLTYLSPRLFYPLYKLEVLSIYENTILQLGTGDLWFSTPVLRSLDLRSNGPGLLWEADVFRGVGFDTKVDLANNRFHKLEYDVFGPVLKNVSTFYGFVNFVGNYLTCDCSVLWLVMDETLQGHAYSAMCKNFTYVDDLDRNVMMEECATGPMVNGRDGEDGDS